MIAPVDLLAEHPGRSFGRGTPRLLRVASACLLLVLVGGVGFAAFAASRAPSWTLDLLQRGEVIPTGSDRRLQADLTFAVLFARLLRLDAMPGVRIDSVEVRRSGATGTVGADAAQTVSVQLRVSFDGDDVDLLPRIRAGLEGDGLSALEVQDYATNIGGVAVSLQFEARMSTERLSARGGGEGEPVAVLRAIISDAGADIVSVRTPSTSEGERPVVLSATGAPLALVRALGSIEQQLSSPSRIESVSLRRQNEIRSSLDVRFSMRPVPGVGVA